MPADLLFELGCEEIPAKFLARALEELPGLASKRLADARLSFASLRSLGTPRRIALEVRGLADRQPDLRERVVGPPVGAAFGPDGAPTRAAIGFAQKNGVDPASLEKTEVEGKVQAVRSALQGSDGEAIRRAVDELNVSMQKIGQAVYGGQDGAASPDGDPEDGEAKEGTVEGEYREV